MSLVGAYVLAGELVAACGSLAAGGSLAAERSVAGGSRLASAFAAYQAEMGDYVAAGLELPPGGLDMFAPRSNLMIRMRALSMRSMSRWPMKQLLAKQFGKADAITLKPYRIPAAV